MRKILWEILVTSDRYFGAQTARSLVNLILWRQNASCCNWAFGILKQSAAKVNMKLNQLEPKVAKLIVEAAEEVILGDLDDHFQEFGKQAAVLKPI